MLNGLGLGAGDEIVTTDAEHFGVVGPLAISSYTVRIARVRDRPADDAYETILAEVGPRTKLIALSHVLWITAIVSPWREPREATGVPVLVDGAQSAGAIPVDATDADYTVSAQKWLCGPDMTGALQRDPDSLRLTQPSYLSQREYDLANVTFEPHEGLTASTRTSRRSPRQPVCSPRSTSIRVALRARRRDQCARPRPARRERGGRHRAGPREPDLVSRRRSRGNRRAARGGRKASSCAISPGTGLVRVSCVAGGRREVNDRALERGEQVDHVPIGVPHLRVAHAPERVPGLLVALVAGAGELRVDRVDVGGRVAQERESDAASARALPLGSKERITSSASSMKRSPPGSCASTCCSDSAPRELSPSRR